MLRKRALVLGALIEVQHLPASRTKYFAVGLDLDELKPFDEFVPLWRKRLDHKKL